jgi:hypothetical protein
MEPDTTQPSPPAPQPPVNPQPSGPGDPPFPPGTPGNPNPPVPAIEEEDVSACENCGEIVPCSELSETEDMVSLCPACVKAFAKDEPAPTRALGEEGV